MGCECLYYVGRREHPYGPCTKPNLTEKGVIMDSLGLPASINEYSKKTKALHVRLSESEYEILTEIASDNNITMSRLARLLLGVGIKRYVGAGE